MIKVSDHALLRFFERAEGVDCEGVREELAARLSRAADAAGHFGAGSYSVKVDGLTFVVRGDVVVTIMSKNARSGAAERPA
jgi:hypothetical protein